PAHGPDPRRARYRIHVGHRRNGNRGACGQRGVQQQSAHLLGRRVHGETVATARRYARRAGVGPRNARRGSLMAKEFTIRRARSSDGDEISRLISIFAAEALMLKRTPGMVELSIDDYVVATDARGHIVGCGALKEYSPSVAEVAAIAV